MTHGRPEEKTGGFSFLKYGKRSVTSSPVTAPIRSAVNALFPVAVKYKIIKQSFLSMCSGIPHDFRSGHTVRTARKIPGSFYCTRIRGFFNAVFIPVLCSTFHPALSDSLQMPHTWVYVPHPAGPPQHPGFPSSTVPHAAKF